MSELKLLAEAEFAEAMNDLAADAAARRGSSVPVGVIPDDPNALAAEGGGDDPRACSCVEDDPEAHILTADPPEDPAEEEPGAEPGAEPRRAGGWRATWLAEVFRAEGLSVVEVESWKSRGDAYPGTPKVSLFHHTASGRNSGPAGGLRVVVYGRPGLDGPIANWLTARNGVIYVIASGVAYNAGTGNARAAGMPSVRGNSSTFGNEMENDGVGEPFTPVQYTAAIKSHAAVHRRMGWGSGRGIGHKEWSTTGKIDPLLDMGKVRRDLATAISRGAITPGEDLDMDQKTFNSMFANALRDPVISRVLGDAVKSAEFGMDPKTGKGGVTVGGALLKIMQQTAPDK